MTSPVRLAREPGAARGPAPDSAGPASRGDAGPGGGSSDQAGGAARGVPVLEVKGLSRYFGGLAAVKDVDLVVPQGSIFGLIGPNGAGRPPPSA